MKNNLLKIALSLGMIVAVSGMQYSTASDSDLETNNINNNNNIYLNNMMDLNNNNNIIFKKNKSGKLKESIRENLTKQLHISKQDLATLESLGDNVSKMEEAIVSAKLTIETFEKTLKKENITWSDSNAANVCAKLSNQSALSDAVGKLSVLNKLRETERQKKRKVYDIVSKYDANFNKAQQMAGELDVQIEQAQKELMRLQLQKECLEALGEEYYEPMNELIGEVELITNNGQPDINFVTKDSEKDNVPKFWKLTGDVKHLVKNISDKKMLRVLGQAVLISAGASDDEKINLTDQTFIKDDDFSSNKVLQNKLSNMSSLGNINETNKKNKFMSKKVNQVIQETNEEDIKDEEHNEFKPKKKSVFDKSSKKKTGNGNNNKNTNVNNPQSKVKNKKLQEEVSKTTITPNVDIND